MAELEARGVDAEARARVTAPAGLDLGRVEHAEIAVAILAELVALKAAGRLGAASEGMLPAATVQAVDPVCGMAVDVEGRVTSSTTAGRGGTSAPPAASGRSARIPKSSAPGVRGYVDPMSDSDNESVDQMSERLEELERKIEEVRHQAEEDDLLENPDEPKYYESGSIRPDEDDQEIAPG